MNTRLRPLGPALAPARFPVVPMVVLMGLTGCGAASSAPDRPEGPALAVETVGGTRLVAIPRSTDGLVHLALYLDAGSRDADPPQVATAAAWSVSATGGATGRVLPEGTVFEIEFESDEVVRCVEALGSLLARRSVDVEELTASQERLRASRRRAHTDEGRAADLLALEALFGDGGEGFSPLGDAEDDARVTREAVEGFLRDHYGPSRALIVAAGDFDRGTLRDAIVEHFDGSPGAREQRGRGAPVAAPGVRSRVSIGDRNVVTGALRTNDAGSAMSAARAVEAAARGTFGPRAQVRAHGFGVRGGGLVLVRIVHLRPPRASRRAVTALGRVALEAGPPDPLSVPSDPRIAARIVGSAWLAGEGAGEDNRQDNRATETAIGVGVVALGGRGDRRRGASDDPDAALQAQVEERVQRTTTEAFAQLTPELRGEVNEASASVTLAGNGARIDVRRRSDDVDVAIAVRFLGGAGSEPTTLHGREALLARLAATACGGLESSALRQRLRELSATITPLVDAATGGMVVHGPKEHAEALIDLTLDCALSPSLRSADLVEARLVAIGAVDGGAAAAGLALAPGAPGAVAPLGSVGTLQSVGAPALRRQLRATRVGARTAVAIVGDIAVEEAVGRVARRISGLDAGRLPQAPTLGEPVTNGPLAFDHPGDVPRVVIGLIASGPGRPDASAARAFARSLANELGRRPGVAPVEANAEEIAEATWVTVTLDVAEANLDALPTYLGRAAEAAAGRSDDLQDDANRSRRWQNARPEHRARELSRDRLVGAPRSQPDLTPFLTAPPTFSIGRPR
ncbi:MAG: hypothetical protein JRH11_08935 [Deltaproteobacteria bacterium]|nr:hypothetical protein [Deltaproteobacteria bacterium]